MQALVLALGLVTSEPQLAAATALLGVAPKETTSAVAADVERVLLGNPAAALQSREATGQFLDTAKGLGVDCDPALDQCLLELTGICTVEQAVYGVVDGQRLTLRLAVVKGSLVRTATVVIEQEQDVFVASLKEAVSELLAPGAAAALVVDAPAGSVISLDGLERGTAPLASAFNGVSAGQHFVDVRFPDGATTAKAVVLSAGQRTRVIAVPRPLGADVLTWSGWGSLGVAAVSTGIATFSAGVYLYARGRLEDFSTHYAVDVDYNDSVKRTEALHNQDLLTDLSTYGYPLFITGAITGAAGGGLLFVGYKWSDFFDPPTEETAR